LSAIEIHFYFYPIVFFNLADTELFTALFYDKIFKKGMEKRGERMSEKYFIQMMKEGDLDGDGCINYEGKMEFTFYLFLLHKTHFIIK
jgi:hypothetical protein